MNICFIMYPWENVEPAKDSTLRIIHECMKRKHRVVIATPAGLTMRNSITNVFGRVLTTTGTFPVTATSLYKKVKIQEKMLPLAGFDVIFMRANPPIDSLMLNFLDSVRDDVFFINDIQGLREANNKLYTASLDNPTNEYIPATHVSKNKEYLKRVITESEHDKMILKPLDGMGGRGVIVVEKNAMQNINSLLDFYISQGKDSSNYVILQEYIEGADEGDVRVLLLNGEPIGAMKRVPAEGDHRSNVSAGGTVKRHTLSKQEKDLCKVIGKRLVADGLYFVGLDIIKEKLIEVNVCSPGGIVNINRLNKTKLQKKVVDFVENVVKFRSVSEQRKTEFREKVENA
ncbi:MAG: glutathione synthase [Crocinitomicaceae bacterium]